MLPSRVPTRTRPLPPAAFLERSRRGRSEALLTGLLLTLGGCGGDVPLENALFVPVLSYRLEAPGSAPTRDPRVVPRETFIRHVEHLAASGYTTATLSELAAYMRREARLPPRTVVLTFEDAWQVAPSAGEVLARHGFSGTFFLSLDVDSEQAAGALDWRELRAAASHSAFEFGLQPGRTSPDEDLVSWLEGTVTGKGPLDVVWEVQVRRQFLEEGLGRPVRAFSLADGRTSPALTDLARRARYTALLTRRQTTNHAGGDPMAIGRYPVLSAFGTRELDRLLAGEVNADIAELLETGPAGEDSSGAQSPGAAPP